MDAEIATLASYAAAALIGAMTKDGWEQTKESVVALWRRHRPDKAVIIEDALESARSQLIGADDATCEGLVPHMEGRWHARWESLLEEHPEAASDVVKLIEQLQASTGGQRLTQHVWAGRDAYVAGRDQRITRRPEV